MTSYERENVIWSICSHMLTLSMFIELIELIILENYRSLQCKNVYVKLVANCFDQKKEPLDLGN